MGDDIVVPPLELFVGLAVLGMADCLFTVLPGHLKQLLALAPLFVLDNRMFMSVKSLFLQSQRGGVCS